jgi:hypothetical protein
MKSLINIMFRIFFLVIILYLILFNFRTQLPSFISAIRILKHHQAHSIGREFVALIPYLSNVPYAGYISCVDSSHPLTDVAIMGPFQEAQFILAPTILDYFHPFDYHYLILQNPDVVCPRKIQRQLSSYVILKNFNGVSILYRKQGPS